MNDLIREAPAIFVGRVVEVPPRDPRSPSASLIVEPLDVLKGDVPARTTLSSTMNSASCGVFETVPSSGETFLAFAYPWPGESGFGVGLCGGPFIRGQTPWPPGLVSLDAERAAHRAAIAAAPGALAPLLDEARFRLPWDPVGAFRAFKRVAMDHPDLAVAHIGAGRALIALRRFDEAIVHAEIASALPGGSMEAATVAGQARLLAGDVGVLATLRDFRGIQAEALNLSRQTVRGADFSAALIGALDAQEADLRASRLEAARIFRGSNFRRADLRGVRAAGLKAVRSDLIATRLDGADLRDTDLRFAYLVDASLLGVSGLRARFDRADLSRAKLARANLSGASFEHAKLVGADLRNARLVGTNLDFSDLRGADLRGADLRDTRLFTAFYGCGTRFPAGFDPEAFGMVRREDGCPTN